MGREFPGLKSSLAALLALASLAAAAPLSVPHVEGWMDFAHVSVTGRVSASADVVDAILFNVTPQDPLVGTWVLKAPEVAVNWTHERYLAVPRPDDPGSLLVIKDPTVKPTGEEAYRDAVVTNTYHGAETRFLVAPLRPGSASLEVVGESAIEASAARGQRWTIGLWSDSVATSGEFPFRELRLPTKGSLASGAGGLHWTLRGDFLLHVWGTNVTVDAHDQNPVTYPAGSWQEADDSSIVRREHAQLLTLRVHDGVLEGTQERGRVQWASPRLGLVTDGAVEFDGATGRLEAASFAYEADQERVEVAGHLTLDVEGSPTAPSRLHGTLVGSDATLDLASHAASTVVPRGAPVPLGWGLAAGSALLALLAAWVGHHGFARHPSAHPERALAAARRALERGRTRAARAQADRVLRRDPHHVEAWFLRGASLLLEGRYLDLLNELEHAIDQVPRPAPVAFLLGLACEALDRPREAQPWFQTALRDAEFVAYLASSPLMRRFHRETHRPAGDAPSAAYA